jgi:hypothetical protein
MRQEQFLFFSQDFQTVVDKTNLSLQDGPISFRVARYFGKEPCILGMDMPSLIPRGCCLISPG